MPDNSTIDREVTVVIHRLNMPESSPNGSSFELPIDSLKKYFRAVDISLDFVLAQTSVDLLLFHRNGSMIRNLIDQVADNTPNTHVHCFITRRFDVPGYNSGRRDYSYINGMLAHRMRRAFAIFTDGFAFPGSTGSAEVQASSVEAAMFQTCAHELGHVFNLTHETPGRPGSSEYASLMWDGQFMGDSRRSKQSISQSWRDALQVTPEYAQRIQAEFSDLTLQSGIQDCHPFSENALNKLKPGNDIIPGTLFYGADQLLEFLR